MINLKDYNKRLKTKYNHSLTISCTICNDRCPAGQLRDAPCEISSIKEINNEYNNKNEY